MIAGGPFMTVGDPFMTAGVSFMIVGDSFGRTLPPLLLEPATVYVFVLQRPSFMR